MSNCTSLQSFHLYAADIGDLFLLLADHIQSSSNCTLMTSFGLKGWQTLEPSDQIYSAIRSTFPSLSSLTLGETLSSSINQHIQHVNFCAIDNLSDSHISSLHRNFPSLTE